MRSLWLASVALCFTAGAAMAQTATSSPAPTGAPNAAVTSPNASPGNTAPSNGMTTTKPVYSGQNSIKTTSTSSPAPTGAPNAAQITSPGASPGNMAPNNGPSGTGSGMSASSGMSQPKMHTAMGYGHSMKLPADADAKTYLHIAATAIKHHDKALAEEALSHAETRLLTRAVPAAAAASPDDSTAVTAIEHAREALMSGDYSTAASDTRMAMHAHHGMGMSPMGGSDAMGGPSQ